MAIAAFDDEDEDSDGGEKGDIIEDFSSSKPGRKTSSCV